MEVQVRRFGKAIVQGNSQRIAQADAPDWWYVRAIIERALKLMVIDPGFVLVAPRLCESAGAFQS